jgi:3-mercaptopyruvate sulfurtransferase SseA
MTGYVNPNILVSTDWVSEHLSDPHVRIVEADEEVHFYDSGHIPGAVNIPWEEAVREDGTFRSAEEIRAVYESQGVTPDKDVITYCRIGERSALTWFVLHELMGYRRVRNYDGSWTEWGNGVGLPIANPSAVGAAVSQPEQGSGTNR